MKLMSFKIAGFCTVLFVSPAVLADKPAMPAEHPAVEGQGAPRLYGKVVETMDVNSYTYVQIDSGGAKHWAAGQRPSRPAQNRLQCRGRGRAGLGWSAWFVVKDTFHLYKTPL